MQNPSRKRSRVPSHGFTLQEFDRNEDYVDQSSEETSWKSILLYQYQFGYIVLISMTIYLSNLIVMTNAVFELVLPSKLGEEDIVYEADLVSLFDFIYGVDLAFRISYKITKWANQKLYNEESIVESLVIDGISMIPVEMMHGLVHNDLFMFAILRMRVMLRLIRLIILDKFMEKHYKTQGTVMVMFRILCMKLSLTHILALLHYYVYCKNPNERDGACKKEDYMVLWTMYYSAARATLSTATDQEIFEVELILNIQVIMNVFFQTYSFYIVAKMACMKIESAKANFKFMHNYSNVMKTYNFWKKNYKLTWNAIDVEIDYAIKDYYASFLKQRDGILAQESLFKIIPEGLSKTISVDVAFNALEHSHVFRDEEDHVMRFLASLMRFEFSIPGEAIVKRGELHAKMIYVSHGVIQILSQEDGETPVLNLSGGTCLGEMSLFFPYRSSCTVIAQTYCEFVMLRFEDFNRMATSYPLRYRSFRRGMVERIDQARRISKIVGRFLGKKSNDLSSNDILIMTWIEQFKNYIWDAENVKEEQMMRKDRLFYYIDNLIFYVEHLDKLVVPDEMELITDTVFIKSTFHFILQPNSPILFVWDLVVFFMIMSFLILFPYFVGFSDNVYDPEEITFSLVITLTYMIDVYLQIFTAVKTRGDTLRVPRDIFVHRAQQIGFILDCISAFPLEMLVLIFGGEISPLLYVLFQSNRLLKYYKIVRFFNKIDLHMNASLTMNVQLMQHCVHGFFILYYITFIVMVMNCPGLKCNEGFTAYMEELGATTTIAKISAAFSMSVALVTSLHFGTLPMLPLSWHYIIYSGCSIVFYIFSIIFYSNAIAYSALCNLQDLNEQESLSSTINALNNFEVSKKNYDKIVMYLKQIWFIRDLTFNDSSHLSTGLKVCYKNIHYLRFFKRTQIFQDLPYHMLSNFCEYINRVTLPANQVICYGGEICKEFYIIEEGFCTLTTGGKDVKTVKKYDILGLLEVLMKGPHAFTVETTTDCIIMQVTKENFERFLCKNPLLKEMLYSALSHPMFDRLLNDKDSSDEDADSMLDIRKKLMWHELLGKVNAKKRAWTIPANGSVVFYWEIFRCITAYINMIFSVYYCPAHSFGVAHELIIYSADIVSLADISLRFFITYYDPKGIEIKHLRGTSLHYLTHAFLIDLLGVIPFDLFLNYEILFTRINRCIYFYRIHTLIDFLTNRIKKIKYLYYTAILLEAFYLFHFIAFFNNYLNCTHEEQIGEEIPESDLFAEGITCVDNTWITRSLLKRPLSEDGLFWESILLVISLFACVGYRKFVFGDWIERLSFSLWGIFGFFMKIIFISKAVSHVLFMNADLTQYQQAMKNLVRFLSYCKIDKNLKKEVINYFEYIWETRRGKNVKDVLTRVPTALKQDTLYDIYSDSMKDYSIFNRAEKSMIKELLLLAKQETFRKTGILYRVNDVHGTIFYLLKGHVEVVGPDKNRLLTLPPGSIFGCLDNIQLSRHTLMMVAKGHVETLTFNSDDFHKLLRKYPKFGRIYTRMTSFNIDYIIGDYTAPGATVVGDQTPKKGFWFAKIHRPNRIFTIFELILYTFAFCIGAPMEVLLNMSQPSMELFCIPLLHDILWFFRIYYKFHLAYEDEYGMLVYDRKKIAKRYLKNKSGFYLDLVTNAPLDIIGVIMNDTFYVRLLRYNRFLRTFHLFNHMRKVIKKLNINVLTMRTLYTLMYLLLYLQVTSSFVYLGETKWEASNKTFTEALRSTIHYVDTMIYIVSGTCNPHHYASFNDISVLLAYLIVTKLLLLVFLYSSFTSTLQIVTKTHTKYQSDCIKLNTFMNFTDASPPIVDMVQIYLSLLLKVKNGIQFPFLLEEAPYYLREAVLNSMFGFHLRNHAILKNCHVDFVRQLSATMRTLTFFENNQVACKGDMDGCMYFIHEGSISALVEDTLYKEVCGEVLKPGDCFGLNQILYDHAGHQYTYKAEKLTIVVFFRKTDFKRLLKFFPASERHIYEQAGLLNENVQSA